MQMPGVVDVGCGSGFLGMSRDVVIASCRKSQLNRNVKALACVGIHFD